MNGAPTLTRLSSLLSRPSCRYRLALTRLRGTQNPRDTHRGPAPASHRKKTQRLYREEGLTVRKRKGRKRATRMRAPILVEARPNARWSVDFVHDQLSNGGASGGGTWTSLTLDPDTRELFVPVGNPSPAFALNVRGGVNLFTGSIVVLDAETGAYKRHFELSPRDWHDWAYPTRRS